MPNIVFTAGTTFLLIAARNNSPTTGMRAELGRVDQCVRFLRQMSWPAATVAADILHRMRIEWAPDGGHLASEDNVAAMANIKSRLTNLSGADSIEALRDPNSDLAKLLCSIGWQPPSDRQSTSESSRPLLGNSWTNTMVSGSGDLFRSQVTSDVTSLDIMAPDYSGIGWNANSAWGSDLSMENYISSDFGGFASFDFDQT